MQGPFSYVPRLYTATTNSTLPGFAGYLGNSNLESTQHPKPPTTVLRGLGIFASLLIGQNKEEDQPNKLEL